MYKEIKNKIEKYKEEKRKKEEMRIKEEKRKIEEKKQSLLALSEKELLVELYFKVERIENNYNEIMERIEGLDCDIDSLRYNSFFNNDED